MHRSQFLKSMFASAVLGRLPVALTSEFRKVYLLQCFVAGFQFHEGMDYLEEMKEGDLLKLEREPDNAYDDCAVALYWNEHKTGFVPAHTNEMLSYLLDADALSLFAVITHLEHSAKPWENVCAAIYFLQETNHDLPVHAAYLTRIEAPHYRTLKLPEKPKQTPKRNVLSNDMKNMGKLEKQDLDWKQIRQERHLEKIKNKEAKKQYAADKNRETGHHQTPPITDTPFYASAKEIPNRVVDVDKIPKHHPEAKQYFENLYRQQPMRVDGGGRYVHIKDDSLYIQMMQMSNEVVRSLDDQLTAYHAFILS